jgi:uncharacterized protein YndB with AHSA1/START domain
MYVTMSVDIEAPPEKVWPFLVEPELCMVWFTDLKRYEWTSERSGVGSTFSWTEEAGGRTFYVDFETTEWDPPHVFGYRQVKSDFLKSHDGRWVIEATETGSRFTFDDRIEFPYGPFGKVIGYFAARTARQTGTDILARLKGLVEGED